MGIQSANRRVLLVDNGSLEPASTLQLRRLAAELGRKVGLKVEPVSVAHSTKVVAAELEGRRAELLEEALDRCVAEGVEEVIVAPLFVGPSYAIVRHVPAVVAQRGSLKARIAGPLFVEGETRLAEILVDHVRAEISPGENVRVAVVDHGSPSRGVTAVRDAVAGQVRIKLGGEVMEVAACSMERRAGEEFAFNEPLLEGLLARDGWRDGPLVVALLFIAPGKHAGPEGDVAQIVKRARGGTLDGVRFTRTMGAHPLLVEILTERVRGVER
jgi:Uncharacterized conserved protein